MKYIYNQHIGWFVLALMFASVLATIALVVGAYSFVGFGKILYNIVTVLVSSSIPVVAGVNIGL